MNPKYIQRALIDFDFKIALSDISPLVMQYSACNTQANLIDDAYSESDAKNITVAWFFRPDVQAIGSKYLRLERGREPGELRWRRAASSSRPQLKLKAAEYSADGVQAQLIRESKNPAEPS